MDARRSPVETGYVGSVTVAGLAVLVGALVLRSDRLDAGLSATVLVLAAFLVAAEMRPVAFARGGAQDSVSLSGAFTCALLLLVDWSLVLVVQALASLLDDLRDRVTWWKCAFNVAQHSLAVAGAGLVLQLLAGGPPGALGSPGELTAALAACGAFFAVNHVLPGAYFALHTRRPLLPSLVGDLPFQLSVNGTVVAMAPLVVAVSTSGPWLVGLLLIPVLAVHRAAVSTLERDRLALHDPLTGLPNQLAFAQRLTDALADRGPDRHVAVLALSLDHFADVDRTLGRAAASQLLQQVAARLGEVVPEDAVVARLEAGSFLVLLPDLESPWQASACGETLLRSFSDPYALAESAFGLRASLGLTVAPLHGDDPDLLVRHAGVARDLARRTRTGFEVYSEERDDFTQRRLDLLRGLGPALRRRELTVRFQPQVDLATGQVAGHEALLRWQHPVLGEVPPEEFVALAEHAGMMREITDFVLDAALRQAAEWRAAGATSTVSVNVSASVLQDADLPVRVARRLAVWGVPSSALVVELTETAVLSHPERCRAVMADLRSLGVGLSLDDYGTGYASLAHLTALPVDELKIDKSFVLRMLEDRPARLVVRSTVELARELGLRVVAEGVEDEAVARLLVEYGCHTAQGFLYGRAASPAELAAVPARRTVVLPPSSPAPSPAP